MFTKVLLLHEVENHLGRLPGVPTLEFSTLEGWPGTPKLLTEKNQELTIACGAFTDETVEL